MSRSVGTKILAITTVGVITATCGVALIYGWKSDDVVKDTLPQKDLLTLQLAQASSNSHASQQTSAQQYSQQQPQIHHVPHHSFPQNYHDSWADPHSTHYHDPHYWDEHEAYMEYLRDHGSAHAGYGMHDGYGGYNAYDPYGHDIHHMQHQQQHQQYYQPLQHVQHLPHTQHVQPIQPNPQQSSAPPQAPNSGSLQLPPQHFNPLQPAQVKKTEETITTAHLGPLVTSLPQASSAPASAGTTSPAVAAAAPTVPVDTSSASTTPAPVPSATKDVKAPITVNETPAPLATAQPNASAVDAKPTDAKPTETATKAPSTSTPSPDPNDITFDPLPGVLPAEKVNKVIKDRYVDITVHGDSEDKRGKVFITQQAL